MQWEPYEPRWLVQLAEAQHPDKPWLAAALSLCTTCHRRSDRYIYFVDPTRANEPGAAWQFKQTLWLADRDVGNVLLDVLADNRVGGIEFYDRLFTTGQPPPP